MNYESDGDGAFIIRKSNGEIHQRMKDKKFLELMENNSNKFIHNGKEYQIESNYDGDEYYIVNAMNGER